MKQLIISAADAFRFANCLTKESVVLAKTNPFHQALLKEVIASIENGLPSATLAYFPREPHSPLKREELDFWRRLGYEIDTDWTFKNSASLVQNSLIEINWIEPKYAWGVPLWDIEKAGFITATEALERTNWVLGTRRALKKIGKEILFAAQQGLTFARVAFSLDEDYDYGRLSEELNKMGYYWAASDSGNYTIFYLSWNELGSLVN